MLLLLTILDFEIHSFCDYYLYINHQITTCSRFEDVSLENQFVKTGIQVLFSHPHVTLDRDDSGFCVEISMQPFLRPRIFNNMFAVDLYLLSNNIVKREIRYNKDSDDKDGYLKLVYV